MTKKTDNRIVVLRSGGLGDCMLATPALAALRRGFPDAHITLVGDPFSADVFVNSPDIDTLVAMDSKVMRQSDYARELWKLRQNRFSLLVDMHGNGRTFIQSLAIGAPRRVGFEVRRRIRRSAYTDRVPLRTDIHNVLRQISVLEPLGISCAGEPPLRLFLTEKERQDARQLLSENGVRSGRPFVVLHTTAGSGRHLKQWTADRFALVADRISDELGAGIVVSGMGQDEYPMVEEILSKTRRPVVNLFGKTTVRGLSAIIEQAALYVGCDTGPMHLAAAVQTPIVALFGPTDPVQWRPWTPAPYRLIRAGLACSPCPGRTCDFDVECMRSIGVDQVMAAVTDIYGKVLDSRRRPIPV